MAELFMQRRFWKACYGNATILALHTQVSRCPFSIYMYNLSNPNPDNRLVSLGITEAKFQQSRQQAFNFPANLRIVLHIW